MDILSGLKRRFFACPELDSEDYEVFPGVDGEAFNCMESLISDRSGIYVFPCHMSNSRGGEFVAVYVWDCSRYPEPYKRYIICEGYQMSESDEQEYLQYAANVSGCDADWYAGFIDSVKGAFPDWHVCDYSPEQIGILMEHLYYASHRSGPKETLYKAGLECIAYYVDSVCSYSLTGSTPAEIIGHGLSMKMLRFINEHKLIACLYSEHTIASFINAFKYCLSYVEGEQFNFDQWTYLEEICNPDGNGLREGFNRTIFEFLGRCSRNDARDYRCFYRIRSKIRTGQKLKTPVPDEIDNELIRLEYILDFVDDEETLDRRLREQKEMKQLEYSCGEFVVIMPESVDEFIKEALEQHNCLISFVEECAYGYRTVVFLRRKSCVDKSYVTIDISNGIVGQVFARFNQYPGVEVYEFLELYCKIFGLKYDPYALTDFDHFLSREHKNEVRGYARKLRRVMRAEEARIRRQTRIIEGQISIYELYPELLDLPEIVSDDEFFFIANDNFPDGFDDLPA